MPFTLSHTVVAIPFVRYLRFIEPVALVIGTMVPDAGYFVPGLPRGPSSHSLSGSFLTALPTGVLLWVIVALLGSRVTGLIPNAFRVPLDPILAGMKRRRNIMLAIPSIWIGIATHNLLDAFTHPSGWFVERIPFLQKSLGMFPILGELPIFHLLQHLGTTLGVIYLIWISVRRAGAYSWTTEDRKKVAAIFAMIVASFLIVLPDALAL